jgi:hypothetical protein
MTYFGHVKNGQIVLDGPAVLADGTAVSIEPLAQPADSAVSKTGTATAIVGAIQPWDGPDGELESLLAEVQHSRDEDIAPVRDEL